MSAAGLRYRGETYVQDCACHTRRGFIKSLVGGGGGGVAAASVGASRALAAVPAAAQ